MLKSEIVDISKKSETEYEFFCSPSEWCIIFSRKLKRPKTAIGFELEKPKKSDFEQCSDDLLVGSIFGIHLMGSFQSDRCRVLIHKNLNELLVEIRKKTNPIQISAWEIKLNIILQELGTKTFHRLV